MEVSDTSEPVKKKRILKIKKKPSQKLEEKKKLKAKKKIENKVLSKFKSLDEAYLEFDTNIDPKFMNSIDTTTSAVNMDLINNLPKFEFKSLDTVNIDDEDDEDSIVQKEDQEELDIDIGNLEPLTIGNKLNYIDYDKGIIYDQKYNSIGFIDEFGNPNID